MTIGNRISTLRKQMKYSQEYVAEKLGISRQAVSKWEKDITKPDTKNIILLADLFNSSVEYLLVGSEFVSDNKIDVPKKNKRNKVLIIIIFVFLTLSSAAVIYSIFAPVDWEIGACRGGYVTSVFDKYSQHLALKFYNGMEYDKEEISHVEPIKGTQDAEIKGRKIYLEFDVRYNHNELGTVTKRVRFIGTRYWYMKFKWSAAIIEG